MIGRVGRDKVLAAWQSAFTAIVCIRGRTAFAPFAAIRGFLRKFAASEAVERLQKQEDCYDADRNVAAATHSTLG